MELRVSCPRKNTERAWYVEIRKRLTRNLLQTTTQKQSPPQKTLRYGCDFKIADKICCFNRHYAEYSGYWQSTNFLKDAAEELKSKGEIVFYDSITGDPLFVAPRGRSMEEFVKESMSHGWPSFRDEEVVADNVRVLPDGEAVSTTGTHLGHNLPDSKGNRYCINLVCVAGNPVEKSEL